jgi:hypothetical protein
MMNQTVQTAQTITNDVVVLDGVTLQDEKKKGGSTLWSCADGDYPLVILARRADFKGDPPKVAVVTSNGITSIASLFEQATPEIAQAHTNAAGHFQFSPSFQMVATIKNGKVTKLAKSPNQA